MKKFTKVLSGLSLGALALFTNASAAVDVTGVTLDTTPVETIAGTILGALAVIWVARKIIGFMGR